MENVERILEEQSRNIKKRREKLSVCLLTFLQILMNLTRFVRIDLMKCK